VIDTCPRPQQAKIKYGVEMNHDRPWGSRAYPEDTANQSTHAVQVALDRRDNGGDSSK
jgi:hypothetical protein